MSAFGAHLRGRKPAIHAGYSLAVSLGLFFKHSNGGTNAGVTQAAGKAVVLGHAAQVQILDVDHVELAHEPRGQLVQRILARIENLLVTASRRTLGKFAALRAFLFLRHTALEHSKALGALASVLRVGDAFSGRKRGKPRNAEIDADAFAGHGLGICLDYPRGNSGTAATACLRLLGLRFSD
jgi:hypothetical protein